MFVPSSLAKQQSNSTWQVYETASDVSLLTPMYIICTHVRSKHSKSAPVTHALWSEQEALREALWTEPHLHVLPVHPPVRWSTQAGRLVGKKGWHVSSSRHFCFLTVNIYIYIIFFTLSYILVSSLFSILLFFFNYQRIFSCRENVRIKKKREERRSGRGR